MASRSLVDDGEPRIDMHDTTHANVRHFSIYHETKRGKHYVFVAQSMLLSISKRNQKCSMKNTFIASATGNKSSLAGAYRSAVHRHRRDF